MVYFYVLYFAPILITERAHALDGRFSNRGQHNPSYGMQVRKDQTLIFFSCLKLCEMFADWHGTLFDILSIIYIMNFIL